MDGTTRFIEIDQDVTVTLKYRLTCLFWTNCSDLIAILPCLHATAIRE